MSLDLPSLLRLFGGMRRAPTNQSTNQSIPRSTGFLSHELGRLIDYRTVLHDRPINQSINQPSLFDHVQQTKSNLYPSINQSINQSYTCRFVPNYQQSINHYNARAFCVKWSIDGLTCVVASQDNQLHLYETIDALVEKESIDQSINQSSFQPFKQIAARHVGWSIIDVSYSPNSEFVAYSTWSPYIQLCNVHGSYELHESLDMQPSGSGSRICFFAIDFSPSGREVLGGASDGAWYLYDIERKQRTMCVSGHSDDINSVCFVDASGDVLLTGSDDRTIRVWDLRVCSNSGVNAYGRYETQPAVGSFLGHAEGITCVTSAQDGRLIASNGKDQCLKVWDLRSMRSASDADDYEREPRSDYDYRYGNFAPHNQSTSTHAFDTSLATMRGHRIAETLVRCHFSPTFTTANRYLYTGSYRGSVFIYDCLTGDVVTKLEGHSATVRDCSWHPFEPIMLTASWDNTVGLWTYSGEIQSFDQSTNLSNDPAAALFESDDDDDYMPQDDEEDHEDDDDQSVNHSDEAMNDASNGRHQHDQDEGKDIDEEDEDEDEDEEDDDEAEYEIDVDDETFNQTVMSLLADAMMNRIDPMQLIQRMDDNEDADEKDQDDDELSK